MDALGKALSAMLGSVLNNSPEDRLNAMSEEEKKEYNSITKRINKQLDRFKQSAYNAGLNMVCFHSSPIKVNAYGLDTTFDEEHAPVGGIAKDECFKERRLEFAPESDKEIYAEDSLRPAGVEATMFAMCYSVCRVVPDMFANYMKQQQPEEKGNMPKLLDAMVVEFSKIVRKHKHGEGDHYHYDVEIVKRKVYEQEELLGDAPLILPALPIDVSARMDFLSTLEFMDENPSSGG